MSEVEVLELDDDKPRQSFAGKVWETFQLINIEPFIEVKEVRHRETKKVVARLDYLSWANAWRLVMNLYPESTFKFDELVRFDDGTCEQWVEITIKDGEQTTFRRWWLPVLNHGIAPVQNPNALQINNTRMRALVKCLAMMGLGTELYAGEDVPDEKFDQESVSNAPQGTLAPAEIFEGRGHIDMINDALPVDAIKTNSAGNIVDLDKERIDFQALDDVLAAFNGKQELKLWVFDNIHKLQNRTLRNYEKKKAKERETPNEDGS